MADFIADAKKVNEQYYIGVDFEKDLDDETLQSASVSESTSTILDGTKTTTSGTIVYFWVQNGTAGEEYTITIGVTGSSGSYYEKTMTIKVV